MLLPHDFDRTQGHYFSELPGVDGAIFFSSPRNLSSSSSTVPFDSSPRIRGPLSCPKYFEALFSIATKLSSNRLPGERTLTRVCQSSCFLFRSVASRKS